MRYMLLIADGETANPSPEPPDPAVRGAVMAEYFAYNDMLRDRGAYVAAEALQPNTTATTVRVRDGQRLVTDGPFVEAKEAIGGFYLVDASSLDEALELAAACPGAKFGAVEVRPVVDFSEGAGDEAIRVGEGAAQTA